MARIPMGRMAEAIEIARSILFFASDDSSYCTGSTLTPDGGVTA
ncbi:MAG: NAD(P)-dependent dehydrogenase (short-subunit alcohol dehydrogenase family) [Bacteroidia bacterium]